MKRNNFIYTQLILWAICLCGPQSSFANMTILQVEGVVEHATPLNNFEGSIDLQITGGFDPIDILWSGPSITTANESDLNIAG